MEKKKVYLNPQTHSGRWYGIKGAIKTGQWLPRREESGKGLQMLLLISDAAVQTGRSWITNKACCKMYHGAWKTTAERPWHLGGWNCTWKYKYNYEEYITDQIQRLLRSKSPTEKHACEPKSRSMQAGMGSGLLRTRAGRARAEVWERWPQASLPNAGRGGQFLDADRRRGIKQGLEAALGDCLPGDHLLRCGWGLHPETVPW